MYVPCALFLGEAMPHLFPEDIPNAVISTATQTKPDGEVAQCNGCCSTERESTRLVTARSTEGNYYYTSMIYFNHFWILPSKWRFGYQKKARSFLITPVTFCVQEMFRLNVTNEHLVNYT